MYRLILSRALLVLCGVFASANANAFAVFVVPTGAPVPPGTAIDLTMSNAAVPAAFGQGVPLTWKQTSVGVTLAFAPDPPAPLLNGTTTWNANALSTIAEWNASGANIGLVGTAGAGNPCITDGAVVAAFDPGVCLGFLPSLAMGITRLVAVVDSASSVRIVDADIAIITPNTASVSGFMVTNAFDGPIVFPGFDFRRLVLHEFGHTLGLAHPDMVFGDTPETAAAVMHSQSVIERLSPDDRNGVLALYPVVASVGSSTSSDGDGGGGGGGGGGNGLVLALLLAVFVWFKFRRARARHA